MSTINLTATNHRLDGDRLVVVGPNSTTVYRLPMKCRRISYTWGDSGRGTLTFASTRVQLQILGPVEVLNQIFDEVCP